jgi:hypothetical protein
VKHHEGVPVVLAAVIVGAISVFLSLVGLELGHRLGRFAERWSEALSGLVFVAIGVALVTGLVAEVTSTRRVGGDQDLAGSSLWSAPSRMPFSSSDFA